MTHRCPPRGATPAVRRPPSRFLGVPRRIAIAGDWHADTDYAVAAIEYAAKRNADVVVHLGDFGYHLADDYLDAVEEALRRRQLTLGFVDGNHENFDRLLALPVTGDGLRPLRRHIVHLPRGLRWRWGTTRCLAVGGASSVDRVLRSPGRSWWPQESITVAQASQIRAAGPAEVMLCHDCPAGVTVPGADRERLGFPADDLARSDRHRLLLRSIVDAVRPHRLWHGHFHVRHQAVLDGAGYRTVVDGLGKNRYPIENNLVVVDLAALGFHRLVATPPIDHERSA